MAALRSSFDPDGDVPKRRQIKSLLQSEITNGLLDPDEKLPTADTLARALGVTRCTVDHAINALAGDGMVYRVQGKGTFVRMSGPDITLQEVVGIIMPTEGDTWHDMVRTLVQSLGQAGLYCMPVDFDLGEDKPPSSELVNRLQRLISSNPAHLVIRGVSRFPFELVRDFMGQLIFAASFESEAPIEANFVLADYRLGGQTVGEHLISLGHSRIMFLVPELEPRHKSNLKILAGLRDAFREKGIPEEGILLAHDDPAAERLLASAERPSAVFCLGDSRTRNIYAMSQRLGLSIPSDLAVVGFYNTPWCRKLQPHLTSVSIHEEQLAKAIAQTIIDGHREGRTLVAPSLVIRDSCGARSRNESPPSYRTHTSR